MAMAAAFWEMPEMATLSRTAMLKLGAAGIDLPGDAFAGIETEGRSAGAEPVLAARWFGRSTPVARSPSSTVPAPPRHLSRGRSGRGVWSPIVATGMWSATIAREETRTFRLSRLADVVSISKDGSVTIPDGIDLQQVVADTVDTAVGTTEIIARVLAARGGRTVCAGWLGR